MSSLQWLGLIQQWLAKITFLQYVIRWWKYATWYTDLMDPITDKDISRVTTYNIIINELQWNQGKY